MKKIISIVAVLAIVFSFSVTAFAATATMTVAPVEVDVAAGTQDVNVNVVFALDEAASLYGIALNFVLPDGVTLKSVDPSALAAICPGSSNDEVKDLANGSYSYFEGTVEGTTAVDSLTIPCVLTVDTTEAKTYTVSFADGSGICDIETYEAINATCPEFTITVKAAGPVATAKTEKAAVSVNADDIVIDGVTYQNVAVLDGSFTLPTLEEGESLTTAGIEYDGTSVKTFTGLTGGGKITYKALFYGITDDEANALGAKVKTYYTGMFFED